MKYTDIRQMLCMNIFEIEQGLIVATDSITQEAALKLCHKVNSDAWCRQWSIGTSGSFTRELISTPGRKILFPKERGTAVSYCRLLLGDTLLLDDMFKSGLAESPACECGKGRETVDHFLLNCSRYDAERTKLLTVIHDIWESKKNGVDLKISLNIVLTPELDERLSMKESYEIKFALFDFLRDVNRNL